MSLLKVYSKILNVYMYIYEICIQKFTAAIYIDFHSNLGF